VMVITNTILMILTIIMTVTVTMEVTVLTNTMITMILTLTMTVTIIMEVKTIGSGSENTNNATQCAQCCQTYINMRTNDNYLSDAVLFQTIILSTDKLPLLIDRKCYLQFDGSITDWSQREQ